jgi:hypothetical integral membrane protein (TIGR02206 family)
MNFSFIWLRRSPSENLRRAIRYGLATVLIVNESLYHLWRLTTAQWTIQEMLPLHLCAIMVYLSAIMLVTKSTFLYSFLYFLGIGAALQAMITPNPGQWGFPHFRFFQTMISHGAIVTAPIYMTVVERYRPVFKDIWKIMIGLNIYMVPVQAINMAIGSNYLWVARKPPTASVIDYLGPWPWYIVSLEIITLVTCVVLYIPFAILDWKHRRQQVTTP